MLEWADRDDDGKFSIRINRQLIELFERGFTVIERQQRKALAHKPSAQAPHVWLCGHEKPYPVTVKYLRDLTGSQIKQLWKFRQSLKSALQELKNAGVLSEWRINDADKVHIIKV